MHAPVTRRAVGEEHLARRGVKASGVCGRDQLFAERFDALSRRDHAPNQRLGAANTVIRRAFRRLGGQIRDGRKAFDFSTQIAHSPWINEGLRKTRTRIFGMLLTGHAQQAANQRLTPIAGRFVAAQGSHAAITNLNPSTIRLDARHHRRLAGRTMASLG